MNDMHVENSHVQSTKVSVVPTERVSPPLRHPRWPRFFQQIIGTHLEQSTYLQVVVDLVLAYIVLVMNSFSPLKKIPWPSKPSAPIFSTPRLRIAQEKAGQTG